MGIFERKFATHSEQPGLLICQTVAALDVSRSRAHQLLQKHDASTIPAGLSHLHEPTSPSTGETTRGQSAPQHTLQIRLAEEVEVYRECLV